MPLLMLVLASVAYAAGGLFMKQSSGVTQPVPTLAFLGLFAGGSVLQALGMKGADIGVSYVFVLGVEAIVAVVLSVAVLHEAYSPSRLAAIALVVVGVAWLRVSWSAPESPTAMHVLHVTPYLAPAWAFGPVPQRVFDLARAQHARGLTVTVLTTDAMAPHERLRPGETMADGVHIVRVASVTGALRSWLNLSTPIGFGRHAARLATTRHPDVVHLHELYTVENLRTAAVLPRGTCIVLSPHGAERSLTPPWVRGAWHRWGGDALLARTNLVVAASEAEAADLAALYARRRLPLDAARMAVVRHGIDVTDAAQHATRADARARFARHDGPVVLFMGRLSDASGIASLIEAFIAWRRVVPSAQLLVAGADHGALASMRARVTAAGIDAAVHLAGHLTGRDAHLAFAAADLFAVPGRTEGFPTAMLEALASGLPVLGEPSEVMQAASEAGVGRVWPTGVDASADALQQSWLEVSERPALRDVARQVAAQFGWMAAAASMARVYERALTVRP